MKKNLIIIICIIISFVVAFSNHENIFLSDSKNLIGILLTLLGLCFASFSYITSSISNIIRENKKSTDSCLNAKLNKLLDSIQTDILLIFYATIILIVLNLLYYYDIPFISNPTSIDFSLFSINSLKYFISSFITSLLFCLSIYSLYDIIKASFILLRKGI